MFRFKALCPIVIALSLVALAPKVKAESFDREVSEFVSGPGTLIYLGTGVTLPLLLDGKEGKQRALRTLDSLGTSTKRVHSLKESNASSKT